MALVEELGFDAVDAGRQAESWRQQFLAELGSERTPEQHAQFATNHAEQAKQMAAPGIQLK
ncbi:hypothetical protein [Hymenobacter sp. BT188]|uniref:hypothetical protein n=1 Tax=Hymenobacter sp. BT188 TaxID=2763504 RepID=UPI0021CA5832|nr:hypothetical protein [Hymenobacter sp. BT188]